MVIWTVDKWLGSGRLGWNRLYGSQAAQICANEIGCADQSRPNGAAALTGIRGKVSPCP